MGDLQHDFDESERPKLEVMRSPAKDNKVPEGPSRYHFMVMDDLSVPFKNLFSGKMYPWV